MRRRLLNRKQCDTVRVLQIENNSDLLDLNFSGSNNWNGDVEHAVATVINPSIRDISSDLHWQREHVLARNLLSVFNGCPGRASDGNVLVAKSGDGQCCTFKLDIHVVRSYPWHINAVTNKGLLFYRGKF